jgi:starvation-inducible outer membrane lipoprotein
MDFEPQQLLPRAGMRIGEKVYIGGRVVDVQSSESMTLIVVSELPIVEHPTYGPAEKRKSKGQFVIIFRGFLDEKTQAGDRIVAVGTIQRMAKTTVADVSRLLPSLRAQCIHIWHTGGREIDHFAYGGGYEPPGQETFCRD